MTETPEPPMDRPYPPEIQTVINRYMSSDAPEKEADLDTPFTEQDLQRQTTEAGGDPVLLDMIMERDKVTYRCVHPTLDPDQKERLTERRAELIEQVVAYKRGER